MLKYPEINELIPNWWKSTPDGKNPTDTMVIKLRTLRRHLKEWSRNKNKELLKNIDQHKSKIEELDLIEENINLEPEERALRCKLKVELEELAKEFVPF